MQPHYFHIDSSKCNAETVYHWLYKNWLFKTGSQFIVVKNGVDILYTSKDVYLEKAIETEFGTYIPDITIDTTTGEKIYFEIYYSNKKDVDDYYSKWDVLKNIVVEVNVKALLQADYNKSIPKFNGIYYDGIYSDSYNNKSKCDIYYNTIAKYKKEKISISAEYKERMKKLDWFWIDLCNYRKELASEDDVIESYKCMDFSEQVFCFEAILQNLYSQIHYRYL
jgi:hypothetical protein